MREMKDSGIEWIGAIPQDWKTDRLQWHLKEINVSNNPIQTKNILSLTIEAGVIPYAEKGNQGNKAKEDYSQYKIALPDTLVINSMNVIIGAVGISQYFGCVSPVYYVFEPIEGTDLRYIYYLFTNTGFQKEMRKYAKGILEIRLRISSNDMLKRIVPSPPFKEQQRIADYLDKMCAEIDTVLEKTRASIEEYKKLKQAVITQAVTKGIRGDRPMKDSGIEWIGDIPAEWSVVRQKYFWNTIESGVSVNAADKPVDNSEQYGVLKTSAVSKFKSLILCIEEPEAHLHPDAVHSLRNVLLEIAEKKGVQVIISTHSPILVDRNDVSNNVVVSPGHRVYPCESIENVREVLGVRLTDNLSASKVVLVEGESDKRYIEAICRSIAPDVMSKIVNSTLRIESVNSATKMDFQIRLYNSLAVSTLAVLDMDDSGIAAYEQLLSRKTKPASEILQIKSAGMTRCELEDIVKFDAYATIIKDEFNISVDTKAFKDRRKPWSDRLHQAASKSPGVFDDRIEAQIKTRIAEIVVEKGIDAIADYDREYIQNLVEAISRFAG